MMSSNSTPLSSNYSKQSEVITFPSQAEEVTKEEIGKWVDQLMEMPEPEVSSSVFAHEGCNDLDDPLTCVAERILSEESYLQNAIFWYIKYLMMNRRNWNEFELKSFR